MVLLSSLFIQSSVRSQSPHNHYVTISFGQKPGKILKDRLDELFGELSKVANEHTNTAVEMAPLDDLTAAKKKVRIDGGQKLFSLI